MSCRVCKVAHQGNVSSCAPRPKLVPAEAAGVAVAAAASAAASAAESYSCHPCQRHVVGA